MHPRKFSATHSEHPAVIMADGSQTLTYGQLETRANQGAHYIRSLGIANGDTIAIWLPNGVTFFEVFWAAQRAGLYICPISTQFTAEEAAYILNDSGSKLLVTDQAVRSANDLFQGGADLIPDTLPILFKEKWSEVISGFPVTPIPDERAGQQMVYSSGTTGRPKGVRAPLADTSADASMPRAEQMKKSYGFDENSVLLVPAPLYHAAPLVFSTMPQRMGATIVVMRRFDAEELLRLIEKYRVTFVQMVPTMFVRLLRLPSESRDKYDLSSLTHILHAAAPCPIDVKRKMLEWFGPIIYEYYAGSEGNGSTFITPEEWLQRPGSVGKAQLGIIHICNENGQEQAPSEIGLVYFEGGPEFEYLNDPQKTIDARHLQHKDWTTLGDIGYVDQDGYLYLTDRKNFTIISGGVNIYPQEVENLLISHDDVADVAVIGVPNEEMGEEVKAIIQPARWNAQGDELAEKLLAFCRDNLSHVKCPKSIDFERQLPRHDTGKLYKMELRKKYWLSAETDKKTNNRTIVQ